MLRTHLFSAVVVALLLVVAVPQTVRAGPSLLFDVESGTVLHADDAGVPWYPASLTKLMTAYIAFHAIRNGQLTLESTLTMSEAGRAEPPSKVGLPVGAEFSLEWALKVLIVRSANDLAVSVAEGVSGTEAAFVQLMNETARRLAMTGTYFSNPHGLPDRRQVTTARDMGLLARAIIREFPEHQAFFEAPNVRVGGRRLRNRNSLLRTMPDADGMKTGFICNSGYNLVASATRDGRRLVAIVLGADNGGQRATAAQALLEQGFADDGGGGLLSLRRKVVELTNGGLFAVSQAVDMAPTVCRNQGTVRLTQPATVRGWSVALGSADAAVDAQTLLDDTLAPLRDEFYGGRAIVVRAPDTGQYTAMVHNLEAGQCTTICSQLRARNGACEILPPDAFQEIIAALEQEEREAAEQRRQERREQAAAAAAAAAANAPASGTQSASQPRQESNEPVASQNQGSDNDSERPGADMTIEDLR